MKNKRPIIGIPACIKQIGEFPFHSVGAKYIDAIVHAAECTPVLLPAIGDKQDIETILDLVDGILLTGSPSNVNPERYGSTLAKPEMAEFLDDARDATTFPLIKFVLAAGKPLMGICRGFQELNVAFGGTLYQAVHQEAHLMDHRAKGDDLDAQYGAAHIVKLTDGGILRNLIGAKEMMVNSIHGQGIAQLGDGLSVEALAPDGLIEAIRVKNAKSFALAVQWHPEWKVTQNQEYMVIFKAFGDACRVAANN